MNNSSRPTTPRAINTTPKPIATPTSTPITTPIPNMTRSIYSSSQYVDNYTIYNKLVSIEQQINQLTNLINSLQIPQYNYYVPIQPITTKSNIYYALDNNGVYRAYYG